MSVGTFYPDDIYAEGPDYLDDIDRIEANYGFDETYSYSDQMVQYEREVVFVQETATSISLSLFAVFLVVLFITGSLPVTGLVLLSVSLVDFCLLGLMYYVDVELNIVSVLVLVIGLGLAVDYSAHIGHTYLTTEPTDSMANASNAEKRMYKARIAVSKMGSSVLHGGASTFIAVIVISGAKSYLF